MIKDADIREPLFEYLETSYGKVRILEEKNTGMSRADVVMVVENALYGIEIKSDADTYARLASQVKDYDKFYDRNIVVVGSSHAMHIDEHVPEYWGIISVEEIDGALDFYVKREPKDNPKANLKNKLSFLWRPELAILQELNDMPKYKEKSKAFVIDRIVERTEYEKNIKGYIDKNRLDYQISHLLFERDYNTIAETIKNYRKNELQKKIDRENDPDKKLKLLKKQSGIRKKRVKRRRRKAL